MFNKIHFVKNPVEHNEKVRQYNEKILEFSNFFPIEEADLIVVGGGDGTLLRAVNKYLKYDIPIWGVNAGTVGFLMNDCFPEGECISSAKIIELPLIKVIVETETMQYGLIAFNEVAIGGNMNSWIRFDVKERDEIFGSFFGGGLIVSTPQGSTGINKNNGGVVLPLSSNLWSITGDKTERKIEQVITPRRIAVGVQSRSRVDVWVDGTIGHIKDIERVIITPHDLKAKIVFSNYENFRRKRRIN